MNAIEKAIELLSKRINKATGLNHPLDKDAAIDLFIILKKSGYIFTVSEIRSYAISNGWQDRHISKLCEIADKILQGKRVKKFRDKSSWNDNIINLIMENK